MTQAVKGTGRRTLHQWSRRWPHWRWIAVFVVVALVFGLGGLGMSFTRQTATPIYVSIETAQQPITAAIYLAELRGYFVDEGLIATVHSHPTGRQALKYLLDHHSTVAVCADTPFTQVFAQGASISIIAKIGDSGQSIRVIGRKGSGINDRLDSLIGRRLGCVLGTNAEYVIHSALLLGNIRADQLTLVNVKPQELLRALKDGQVDAITCWDPLGKRILSALHEDGVEIHLSDFYRPMWVLATDEAVSTAPQQHAILRAMIRASADLTADPERWVIPLAERMGLTAQELRNEFATTQFRLTLDQSLLLNLEAQRRWMAVGGPEILAAFRPIPLAAVDRQAVTLVHPDLAR